MAVSFETVFTYWFGDVTNEEMHSDGFLFNSKLWFSGGASLDADIKEKVRAFFFLMLVCHESFSVRTNAAIGGCGTT